MTTGWLNGPCTDPAGRVFRSEDGRIYRALFPDRAAAVLEILSHSAVQALMKDGVVARMWLSDVRVDGYGPVVETEKAPFDVPCGRFTFAALKEATIRWLEITSRLSQGGLALTDAHFGNFMLFANNQPRWVDVGSMRSANVLHPERPFRAFSMLWEGMLAPLFMLATRPNCARLARLVIADHPYQGPQVAAGESPLAVGSLVEDGKRELLSMCEGLSPSLALQRSREFVEKRCPEEGECGSASDVRLGSKAATRIAALLNAMHCNTVACIGASTYLGTAEALSSVDVVVIEPEAHKLRGVEQQLRQAPAPRSVALYLQHCMNRLFRRENFAADAVLAVDPMKQLAHDSLVEIDNIAEALFGMTSRVAVVVAPAGRRNETRRMLEGRFGPIEREHLGWWPAGWDLMVGRRR